MECDENVGDVVALFMDILNYYRQIWSAVAVVALLMNLSNYYRQIWSVTNIGKAAVGAAGATAGVVGGAVAVVGSAADVFGSSCEMSALVSLEHIF